MNILYFDCFSGVSGDMILGSFLDLGFPLEVLTAELDKLKIKNFQIKSRLVNKSGLVATKFDVETGEEHSHRHYSKIEEILQNSKISQWVKEETCKAFFRLAQAEAKVHGTSVEKVHFHEVGAIDAIVDITGAFIGLEWFGKPKCFASSLNVGRGLVKCAHGILPVPAPATAELLKGLPIYSNEIEGELITPTGAAVLTTICDSYEGLPSMEIEKIGYGAGSREIQGSPNVLRISKGKLEKQGQVKSIHSNTLVLETNIGDMNPQIVDYVQSQLLELGVHDVFCCPVQMKKSRQGVLLTMVLPKNLLNSASEILFKETTTIGVRYYECDRKVLERFIEQIDISYGTVPVKVAKVDGKIINFSPEYENCKDLALRNDVPYKRIQWLVVQKFMDLYGRDLG